MIMILLTLKILIKRVLYFEPDFLFYYCLNFYYKYFDISKDCNKKGTEKIHELRYGQFRGEHMHIEDYRFVIFLRIIILKN